MLRTTDIAIVAVPVVACLALFAGLGLLNRPAVMGTLPAPTLRSGAAADPVTVPAVTDGTQTTAPAEATTPPQRATPQLPTKTAPRAQPSRPAAPESPALTRGRELAALLYSQRLTPLWSAFTPAVQREWGSFQKFQAYRAGGLKAFGAEQRVVSEQVRQSGGVQYYTRTARFERGPQHDWTLVFGLNSAKQVVAFNIVNAGVLPTAPRQ